MIDERNMSFDKLVAIIAETSRDFAISIRRPCNCGVNRQQRAFPERNVLDQTHAQQ
jgi:hypothetical protein